MIKFNNITQEPPYLIFKKKYDQALNLGQKNNEAKSISSFSKEKNEVDSRFVNLKIIDHNRFIFFTNYDSPKSLAFESHDQISGIFFWTSTNTQIRLKAKIKRSERDFNCQYFKQRSIEKNALAISSAQSKKVSSYEDVLKKYTEVRKKVDLTSCPENWGGFSFIPYYFEFWEGHDARINKRTVYEKNIDRWKKYYIQP